jgi:hypothetical protein
MFGNNPRVNPLESRKQLLIAESELNRAQLAQECVALKAGVLMLTARAKSIGAVSSAAALLLAGLAAFRRGRRGNARAKPSWFHRVLKGAQAAGSIWLAFRSRSR